MAAAGKALQPVEADHGFFTPRPEIPSAIAVARQRICLDRAPDVCRLHRGKHRAFRHFRFSRPAAAAGTRREFHPAALERITKSGCGRNQQLQFR